MGTWGVGLYANDDAADLRDSFKEIARTNWDGARILEWVREEFSVAADPKESGYSDLYLALADLFWLYGIDCAGVRDEALRLIESGEDLAVKRSLGMSERDLGRRAKILEAHGENWQSPNVRPRSRRTLKSPQSFILQEGDCLVYPTSSGRVRNPYVSPAQEQSFYRMHPWQQDGWAAAIVLACRHRFETFARYLVAVLRHDEQLPPDPARFGELHILHSRGFQSHPLRRVHLVSTTRQHLERMEVDVVGNLPVKARVVREAFAAELARPGREFANDAWTLPDLFQYRPDRLAPADVADPISAFLSG